VKCDQAKYEKYEPIQRREKCLRLGEWVVARDALRYTLRRQHRTARVFGKRGPEGADGMLCRSTLSTRTEVRGHCPAERSREKARPENTGIAMY
jgi:hypothetical protein